MSDVAKTFLLAVAVALVVALALAVWMIGAETLRTLGLVLVSAIALAIVLGSSALPIRAYRRRDPTGEMHYHHDGTRTVVKERILDGRAVEAPRLLQLPAQPQGAAFPELLRAAYQAGTLTDRRNVPDPAGWGERELREIDLDPDREGWEGDIAT